MNKRIAAKTVNGNVIDGFYAMFAYDAFSPDTILIEFDGRVIWFVDREMLLKGGDFGGDVAITVDEFDTVIGLIDYKSGSVTTIEFDTLFIRDFLLKSTANIDIPHMRKAEIDNLIVEFYNWA